MISPAQPAEDPLNVWKGDEHMAAERRLASMSKRRQWLVMGSIVALIIVSLILLYVFFQGIESASTAREEPKGNLEGRFEGPKQVEYEGAVYEQKRRLTSILVMGIDKSETREKPGKGFRAGGQADFLALMLIDSENGEISTVQIDRDTMTEITTLGIFGNVSGMRRAQISLQHGFGDGAEQSAELTRDAVSRLFGGMPVDFYFALNMDAIAAFNDVLGGVEVEITDDFTAQDPMMKPGARLQLTGSQAELFVRGRMSVGDGTNRMRMARQRVFLSAAGDLMVNRLQESASFADRLLDTLNPYMVSNMRRGRMINELNASRGYTRHPMLTLEGQSIIGKDGFMEFHSDEKALEKLILALFFKPVS